MVFLNLENDDIYAVKTIAGSHPRKEPYPINGLLFETAHSAFSNQSIRLLTADGVLYESSFVPVSSVKDIMGDLKPQHKSVLFPTTGRRAILFVDYQFVGQKERHTAVFRLGDHDYTDVYHPMSFAAWPDGDFSLFVYASSFDCPLNEGVNGVTYWLRSKDSIHSQFALR